MVLLGLANYTQLKKALGFWHLIAFWVRRPSQYNAVGWSLLQVVAIT